MKKAFRRPRTWHHPRLWLRRIGRSWPFLVWLGAAVLFGFLYSGSTEFVGMSGVVESVEDLVAPLETARLLKLHAVAGQRVKAGDVLVQMDTVLIDADLAVERATAAEDGGSIGGYQEDILQLVSRFEAAVQDARTALATEQQRQQGDEAELKALKVELARREALLEKRLINEEDVGDMRPQIAALESTVQAYPALIAVHEDRLKESEGQRAEINRWLQLGEGEGVSAAITRKTLLRSQIFQASLQRAESRKALYTLRATANGVVSQVFFTEGTVVQAGTPIVEIVANVETNRVVGFLSEPYVKRFKPEDKALVWRRSGGEKVAAKVLSVSPSVRWLPGRVTPIGGQPLRGRRVVFVLKGEHDFIPGETVRIQGDEPTLVPGAFGRILARLRPGRSEE